MGNESITRRTVLIIEDDPSTLEYLSFLLEMSGYHVEAAVTGAEGLHVTQRMRVDAILLDRRLPDVDGMTLCSLLRQQTGQDMPIVMMTADAESGLLASAQAAGATSLLRKPFMPQTLLATLQEHL